MHPEIPYMNLYTSILYDTPSLRRVNAPQIRPIKEIPTGASRAVLIRFSTLRVQFTSHASPYQCSASSLKDFCSLLTR